MKDVARWAMLQLVWLRSGRSPIRGAGQELGLARAMRGGLGVIGLSPHHDALALHMAL